MKGPRPRLLGHFHLYPPSHNAGAEWMAHSILSRLQRTHGWDVRVITTRPPRRRNTWDGIPVELVGTQSRQLLDYRWADVAITHLDVTRQAMACARRRQVPLVHLVHNHAQLDFHRVGPADAALVVWNSRWMAEHAGRGWPGDSLVVIPPVWTDRYRLPQGPEGHAITLLNTAAAKGGALFWALAEALPEYQFLGVCGSYGDQVPQPRPHLPNVEVMANQPDVRRVYARTRLLLMPSTYESWGRVAVEAAASGIPTIASDTPGLVETGVPTVHLPVASQDVGVLAGFGRASATTEPEQVQRWAEAIRRLMDDPVTWHQASVAAEVQAMRLEALAQAQVAELDEHLRALL